MRIIAGSAGGITIKVPRTELRPTSDRVREAIFSMLGDLVPGARVLDLFSGSGAMGLEALSRGAGECVFVEKQGVSCTVIEENISRARLQNARVMKADAFTALDRLARDGATFDLVFADPPYAKRPGDPDDGRRLIECAPLRALLRGGGWFVLETMVTKRADEAMRHWSIVRDRTYGGTRVLLLQSLEAHAAAGPPDLQSSPPARAAGDDATCPAEDA